MKAFTDIEQSKKLAEILPLESADMRIGNYVGESGKVDGTNIHYYRKDETFGAPEIIKAWSLAALLDIYPMIVGRDVGMYCCWQNSKHLCSRHYDNPIDACYEMIIKLNERNIL